MFIIRSPRVTKGNVANSCACADLKRGTIMAKAKGNKDVAQSPESIVAHFQQLRNEQRNIIAKIAELEGETNEHK